MRLPILFFCLPWLRTRTDKPVECPKFYPSEDTVLAEVPYRHQGIGMVPKAWLQGASAYLGEFNCRTELQGLRKDVKEDSMCSTGFRRGAEGAGLHLRDRRHCVVGAARQQFHLLALRVQLRLGLQCLAVKLCGAIWIVWGEEKRISVVFHWSG
ncbi:hypothetical protein [Telluria aromaticivorans]|uniref:Uncharacterized protein n=1 Tax=Telluria aromaticivorans TaxID=2725995 RepID=A0A7Y2K2U2_9BURK|nr:hypothetical protein [Telluria aromaticivorans]NNG25128.1 hypothetical protein [Telluria aromaticivorans]